MEKSNDEIAIEGLKFRDISNVLKMYKECSEQTKQNFPNGVRILTSKLGLIHLCLSLTPLKPFLMWQISPLAAKRGIKIIGLAYLEKRLYKNKAKSLTIIVKDEYQGKGVGNKLINKMLSDQDEVWLGVLENNKRAIKLYEKHGFKTIYTEKMMKWEHKKVP